MPTSRNFSASQKGFSLILVILGLAILLGIIGLVFYRQVPRAGRFVAQLNESSCPQSPIFTVSPIDPKDLLSITPLGNLNPPDHTTPTDHIYLTVKNNNNNERGTEVPVYSPADMIISRITHQTAKKSGQIFTDDYQIDFSPCKDVQAKFGHLTKLSENLMSLIDQSKDNCQTRYPREEDEYIYCNFEVNLKIKAGELLGEAGAGRASALDFWTRDFRTKPLEYANPSRYQDDQLHIVCPIDLFEPSLKKTLSEKFGRYEQKRTIEPLCGEVNQDVSGTAQGNWITNKDGLMDQPESWDKSLALVHDNVDPKIGVVVIGGIIAKPQRILFNPTQSGNINREFSQVKADGKIYCYEGEGRVLIELVNETSLKAEYQTGSCQNDYKFVNPTIYYR